MAKSKSRPTAEINSGSMADIAFLLLIFFLVTTTIASDKGLPMTLPQKQPENAPPVEINKRNLLNVLVNSRNQLLVDEEPMAVEQIKDAVIKFVTNNDVDPKSSESPQKAIISIKTDRGTDYGVYLKVLDAIKAAYHQMRAKHLGITPQEYLSLDPDEPADKEKLELAKQAFPANISEADPSEAK